MQELYRPSALDVLTRPVGFAALLLALSACLSWIFADWTMPVPDEGALLTAAVKLLHGGVFYRDVDAYALPGVSYLLAAAMAVFGEHLGVARALAGSVFCATVLGTYACALALVDEKRAALCGLGLLALKFVAFPIYTMTFYADVAVASALLALALFLQHGFRGPSWLLVSVGVLCGLSIATKQSTGLLVAIVFALVLGFPAFAHGPRGRPGRMAELGAFAFGLLITLGSMCLYFAVHGVLPAMARGALLRPFTGYLPTSGISFLPPLAWWKLGDLQSAGPTYFPQLYFELVLSWTRTDPTARDLAFTLGEIGVRTLYTSVPIVFVVCAALWVRHLRVPSAPDEASRRAQARFFSAAGVCLAIVVSAFPRADFIHVITIYPPVALMLFAIAAPDRLGRTRPANDPAPATTARRRLRFEAVGVAALLIGSAVLSLCYAAMLTHRIELDRAALWVKPQHAWLEPLVEYVQAEVPEGEPLFVYGHEAQWYFLTDRYTPRSFSQLYPGMTGDRTGEGLARLIRETRPRIVLQGVLRWPGMPPLPAYTRALQRTLDELYEVVPDAIPAPPHSRTLRIWRLRA